LLALLMLLGDIDFLVYHFDEVLQLFLSLALLLKYFKKADELSFVHFTATVKINRREDF